MVFGWMRDRAQQRAVALDGRVLAELQRIGPADALEIRRTVRTQHALIHQSLTRLEETGAISSRLERPSAGKPGRKVYTAQDGGQG